MKTKFRNWLIKLIVNKIDYWFIKNVYESANFKYQREQVELGDQLKVQAKKEMEEFIAKQDPNYLEKINREAFPDLVPLSEKYGLGIPEPIGTIVRDDFGFKFKDYIPNQKDTTIRQKVLEAKLERIAKAYESRNNNKT